MRKKTLAVFTAAGCRACETALLDLHYQVNSFTRWADPVFWPYVLGSQLTDLDRIDFIDVTFFAGAIQTDQDREMAAKLRAKSRILVALGSCAAFGGLPGLANLAPAPAAGNVDSEGPPLPGLLEKVLPLSAETAVEYTVPGCPPTESLAWAAFQALAAEGQAPARLSYTDRLPRPMAQAIQSGVLPPAGGVFAGEKAVCAGCSRVKEEKKFRRLIRPFQAYDLSGRCLLEQGLICLGLATREGCGGVCTGAGQPCRGCFGKAEAVFDPGAKMVSAVASTFDSNDRGEIEQMSERFVDLAGTFYRYTLPAQCALLAAEEKSHAEPDL